MRNNSNLVWEAFTSCQRPLDFPNGPYRVGSGRFGLESCDCLKTIVNPSSASGNGDADFDKK